MADLVIRPPNKQKYVFKRRITEQAKTQINSALATIDWKDVISSCDNNDPEEAYNNLICIYTRLYDKYFPIKRIHYYSKIIQKSLDNQSTLNLVIKSHYYIKNVFVNQLMQINKFLLLIEIS